MTRKKRRTVRMKREKDGSEENKRVCSEEKNKKAQSRHLETDHRSTSKRKSLRKERNVGARAINSCPRKGGEGVRA